MWKSSPATRGQCRAPHLLSVEELLELHLAILEGVQDRYERRSS